MTQAQVCETCGLPVSGPFTTRCFPSCDVPTAAEMDGTGRTQEPSVDVRRWSWAGELDGGMWEYAAGKYVLYSDHDAALSSLRTELVAARAENRHLTRQYAHWFELATNREAEIATLRAENDGMAKAAGLALQYLTCESTPLSDADIIEPLRAALGRGK